MAGLIGQNFGRYKILELLGEGGMATVYKAHDSRLEREVAIKVIRRDAFPAEETDMLLKRFEREAKFLGRLSHPNIVGVIDYGEHEDQPYLVMVYVPGGTLKQKLGNPIPWREAVRMVLPIARALEYVHDQGIINRDVKPSNVLLTEKGQPMLSDFGLVKLFSEGKKAEGGMSLTGSGMGIGTPDYMAPEQWTGDATALSDLYSLGVVLYEMITSFRPYTADTPAGILLKQAIESLPLPKQYVPDLPQDVESVLLKVLAKDPKDRYASVHAFANELEELLAGHSVTAATISPEKLRQQMTGIASKGQPASSADPKRVESKKGVSLPVIGFGALIALVISGGVWFASNGAFAPAAATQSPSPSATTAIESTYTPAPSASPTRAPSDTPPPTQTSIPSEIRDGKNISMRLIPGGEFTMGSNDTGDPNSRPAHTASVDAFYIDTYEATNEQFSACVFAVECRRPLQTGSATRTSYYTSPVFENFPAIFVDWKMANQYCTWRGARLPTEAEWEKAARGTDARLYPWGNDDPSCNFANLPGCVGDTTAVDQYDTGVSIYGVFGMAGNVWEWTSSSFKRYPYDAGDGREDLTVPGERIARGGSWHIFGGNSGNARTDTRLKLAWNYNGAYVGIRCALSAP